MTLADLLNTLESADMLRIIKGDEEIFVGYLALFAPEVGHTNCKLYEQYKFDEVRIVFIVCGCKDSSDCGGNNLRGQQKSEQR